MEEVLKQILNKLEKIEEGQKELTITANNLDKREQEHFNLLFEEQNRIYTRLDKRLSIVENKLEKSEHWQEKTGEKLDTLLNTVDSFVNRTVKVEEEITVINHQVRNHEDRITELETIE